MSVHTAAPMAAMPAQGEVTVFGVFAALLRKKRWIIVPAILAALAAVAYVTVTPPQYLAEATIIVEPQESPFTRPQGETGQQSADSQTVASQVQVVKSLDVANIVIDKLKLAERAEFNPELRPAGLLSTLTSFLGGSSEDEVRKAVLREYFDHLTTYAVNDTRVIVVEFWSRDDKLSAEATNAIADAYLAVQREINAKMTSDATGWLERQIADLRAKVSDAERRVELYRTENGLFTTGGGSRGENDNGMTIQSTQLAELSTQLSQARAQRSDAQARARLIREKLESGQASETREVANSGLIQRLQEERVRLASQIAELASTYLPAHPRMQELRAQLSDLDRQIRVAVEKIVASLENDAAIAAAREKQLETNIDALKSNVALANENEVQLRALEREAKAQRDLLSTYLARYREAAARNDNQFAPADARIVSRATVPLEPFFPSKVGIPVMAVIAALVLSSAIVMTLELAAAYSLTPAARADAAVSGEREQAGRMEPYLEPGMAADDEVPVEDDETASPDMTAFGNAATDEATPDEDAPEKAPGAIASAMRRAGAMMQQRGEARDASGDARAEPVMDAPAEPVIDTPAADDATLLAVETAMVVTSVGDQAVVYNTALAHGRRLAAEGAQVILIDTLAGEGFSASQLGRDPMHGYFDLVSGIADFSDVIFRDHTSRMDIMAPGRGDPDLADDADGPRAILEALEQAYDTILLVAPPVYSATLATIAGEVAVVRPDDIPDDVADDLARMLADVAVGQVTVVAAEDPQDAPYGVAAVI